MDIVTFFIVGLIAGWLVGLIRKGRGFGLAGNLIVGVLGALLGGFLFRLVNIAAYGLLGNLVMATLGALVLLFLLSFIGNGKPGRR